MTCKAFNGRALPYLKDFILPFYFKRACCPKNAERPPERLRFRPVSCGSGSLLGSAVFKTI